MYTPSLTVYTCASPFSTFYLVQLSMAPMYYDFSLFVARRLHSSLQSIVTLRTWAFSTFTRITLKLKAKTKMTFALVDLCGSITQVQLHIQIQAIIQAQVTSLR